jgi:D-proline reductase (dithiol) PrdB
MIAFPSRAMGSLLRAVKLREPGFVAKISDLKLAYQLFMKAYPYRRVDWRPGAVLREPLSDAKVAVVTTAAYYRPDQPPFDTSIRGGDYSYRVIPVDTDLTTLRIAHRSDAFDITGIAADKNLALPLDRLKELAEEGVIGSVAPRHFSFMGSIAAPGRLISNTAPEVARMLLEDEVDAVLLTPV